MRGEKTRVLVAPLDWGLGHATRCIPVIRAFLKNNCAVILAGEGHVENLLCREFPSLPFIKLKGYRIQYGNTKWKSLGKIITQIPKILKAIEEENHWLQDLLEKEKIDIVISDNRYGLQHESVYSLFITHQLLIKTNLVKRADLLLQKLNYQYINAFNACWVRYFATAFCSAMGAQAPTCDRIDFIFCNTSAGPMLQPTRTPVAAKILLMASTKMV